jgi:hypothetical protein
MGLCPIPRRGLQAPDPDNLAFRAKGNRWIVIYGPTRCQGVRAGKGCRDNKSYKGELKMVRSEKEIREKIADSMQALEDFAKKPEVAPEDFFTVARQATYLTALYWVLGENVPKEVTSLAVPIIKKMGESQAKGAEKTKPKK